MTLERGGDHRPLALEPGGVHPRAAADAGRRRRTGERAGQGGGGRRVADPDLADDEAVHAAFGELRGEAGTGGQRGIHLRCGEGRPREHVGGPVGDLGVAHTGRGGADQADVGDQHVVSCPSRQHPDGAVSARRGGGHLRADLRGEQARAVDGVTVVGGADQHPGTQAARRGRPGDRGPALDERLERPEAPAGLDELVEAVASGDRCRSIQARPTPTRPRPPAWRAQSFVAPALLHHDVARAGRATTSRPPPGRGAAGARRASPRRGRRSDRRGRECRAARGGRRADRSSPSRRPALRRARPATGSRSRRPSSRRRSRGSCRARGPRGRGRRGRSRRRDRVGLRRRPRSSGRGTDAARSSKRSAWRRRSRCASRRTSTRVVGIAQHDQPPRLHEPDGRRLMRCLEDPLENVGGHLVRPEASDVAPLGDRAIDRGAHVVGIAPAHRVGGTLGCPGVVESRRRRRDGRVGLGRTRAGTVEWRRKRGDARKPVRIRHGRATVTGSARAWKPGTRSPRTLQVRDARSRGGRPDGSGSGVVRRLILVRHAPTAATRSLRVPGRRAAGRARHPPRPPSCRRRRAPRWCAALSERCRATAEAAGLTIAVDRAARSPSATSARGAGAAWTSWSPSARPTRGVDGRSGQRAARRREPARVRGARGRVARRAGAPGRHVPRDHPRRRRQGCGRARARGADRGVLARRLRAAVADRAARP